MGKTINRLKTIESLWSLSKHFGGENMIGALITGLLLLLAHVGKALPTLHSLLPAIVLACYSLALLTGSAVCISIVVRIVKQHRADKAAEINALVDVLENLRDRFTEELKTGEPASENLGFLVQDAMVRLRRWQIPTPNFVGLPHLEMVYFKSYLTVLLVALEEEDLEDAKTAIHRAGLPVSMIPDPRWND